MEKFNALLWFLCINESDNMEVKDKYKEQRGIIHLSEPERHMPYVSLLLWCEMVAIDCFI